jgi:hypothetical protein
LKGYGDTLRELRKRRAYVKLSGLYRPRSAADAPFNAADYKPVMDFIWDIFGEDYLVYAGRNKAAIEIMRSYFLEKGRPAAEKFFWKNSITAFRWVHRDPKQPRL